MQVEDRTGSGDAAAVAGRHRRADRRGEQGPADHQPLFSTFRASVPQLYANVDRVKAKKENVAVTDVFQALQVYLGSFYINDFNYLGRTYRVIAQADAPFRAHATDVAQLKTRNAAGAMVPLGAVMDMKKIADADRINRYNQYPSAEINGAGAPGVSSGQAIEIMANIATKDSSARLQLRMDRTGVSGGDRPAIPRYSFFRSACCSYSSRTRRNTRASRSRSAIILIVPMCLLVRHRGRLFQRAWTTTSSRRSASWCWPA